MLTSLPVPDPFLPIPGLRERSGRLLVRVRAGREAAARDLLRGLGVDACDRLRIWSIAAPEGVDEAVLAGWLRAAGGEAGPGDPEAERSAVFEWIRPDWRVFTQSGPPVVPNDVEYPLQWYHPVIGCPAAWAVTTGLREVVVGIVDTGVDLTHVDLSPRLVPGYCSYITSRLPQAQNGVVIDSNGHGTAVAGVAGAAGNNLLGTAGIGWNLSIMPVRATNPAWPTGGATSMDIINGALWAADHGARIVNVSFSGVSEPYVQALGAQLRSARVLLIWPMDSFGLDYGTTFDHPDVLVVAGTDPNDAHPGFSSTGLGVDLAAPAVGMYTTIRGGGSWYQDGNSFAAPVVAGAAGLILSVATELTPAEVERVLEETSRDLGAPGRDPVFGWGRIDVGRAVWLAPLRQMSLGAAPEMMVRRRYSVEDLYAQVQHPQDLDGNGSPAPSDAAVLEDLLRFDEAGEMTYRGR